jgi:hypothetical protein
MKRLARAAAACSDFAAATVFSGSYARSGDTSSETNPSTPAVL